MESSRLAAQTERLYLAAYSRESRIRTILLIVVLTAGAALRLHRIDQPFVDFHGWRESSTAMMAENIFRGGSIFLPEINWDGAGPSYNGREFQLVTFIAASLYNVTGQVDWVGRAVSVCFGVWGIFALFKLIAVIWDERRAFAGAAVMAVFPGSVFVDREFLPDPAMVALMTTACWLSFAYLRSGRRRDLVCASIASALGLLTKLTGLCVLVAIGYVVWRTESADSARQRRWLFAAALAVLPVALYYAWAFRLSQTYPPFHFAGSQGFIWNSSIALWLENGFFVNFLLREFANAWTWPGLALIVGALLFRRSGGSPFFHWWLFGSGGLYFAIGASHLVWQPYNLHLFNPPAAALAGAGLVGIADAIRKLAGEWPARITCVAVLFAIVLTRLPHWRTAYGSDSSDALEMGLALRDLTRPNELIVTIPEFAGDPVALYYARRHGWVFPQASLWPNIPENWDRAIAQPEATVWLDQLRQRGARWLAVVAAQRQRLWAENPSLAAYVNEHFDVSRETRAYVVFRAR